MGPRWLAVTAVSSGCGDGDRDRDWRRHGVIGGVGGRLGAERHSRWQWWPARRERRGQWRGGRLGVRGATDGGRPDWLERRVRWWRRPAWRDEARPTVKVATTVREGAASRCGAVFGTRRLAGRGCRCSGPTCRQRLSDSGASIRGLVSDEQRVKTQPGFGRTDNDGSFPLPRALSCHLIPQGWLPGESPVLALLSP
uniref:Uncharacterized protein n=1 Tax=Oryza nivara TaxID=4536 RepID=A0A0E0G970_ORYNI